MFRKRKKRIFQKIFRRTYSLFRLDLTHVREYYSKEVFLDLLERNRLKISEYRIKMVKRPLPDLIIRIFIKMRLIKPSNARKVYIESKVDEINKKIDYINYWILHN
jgi:hypothetical protein